MKRIKTSTSEQGQTGHKSAFKDESDSLSSQLPCSLGYKRLSAADAGKEQGYADSVQIDIARTPQKADDGLQGLPRKQGGSKLYVGPLG